MLKSRTLPLVQLLCNYTNMNLDNSQYNQRVVLLTHVAYKSVQLALDIAHLIHDNYYHV